MESKILPEKEVGVVEFVDRKLRYFCEDFNDYELLCATLRQVAIGWYSQEKTQSRVLVALLLPEENQTICGKFFLLRNLILVS